jgi:hypothetical protein
MDIEVNAPVDKVWARVGKYCDIGEWGFPGCIITSGKDGDFGAVRTIGNEVLVGKTKYSYVYPQPLRTSGAVHLVSRHPAGRCFFLRAERNLGSNDPRPPTMAKRTFVATGSTVLAGCRMVDFAHH